MCHRLTLVLITACSVIGCAARDQGAISRVPQTWTSGPMAYGETDSLATFPGPDGKTWIAASAKEADRLDIFEAQTGAFVRSVGQSGPGRGAFRYPNGVACARLTDETAAGVLDVLLVVERDNRRVQAWRSDTLEPVGVIASPEFVAPYGIALHRVGDRVVAYVTDEQAPPTQRVRAFALNCRDHVVSGEQVRVFGAATGAGVLHEPESIVVDTARRRIYLCDEADAGKNVKVYTTDGEFTGRTFADGMIQGDPEGIAMLPTPRGDMVVVTDQQKRLTTWRVFSAETLEHVGDFTGAPTIANTDGICIHPHPIGDHPAGLLFAVHDDGEVRAYDLAAVRSALGVE